MDSFPLKLLRQLIRNFGVSGYVHTNPEIFLNRIPFYMNRPPAYTKPVNLDTESALFLNRERFKALSTRIRIKKYIRFTNCPDSCGHGLLRWCYTGRFARTIFAHHRVAMLEQCCNHSKKCRNNVKMTPVALKFVLPFIVPCNIIFSGR